MKRCFADFGKECYALKEKSCKGCSFYKTKDDAIKGLKLSPGFELNADLKSILGDIERRTFSNR